MRKTSRLSSDSCSTHTAQQAPLLCFFQNRIGPARRLVDHPPGRRALVFFAPGAEFERLLPEPPHRANVVERQVGGDAERANPAGCPLRATAQRSSRPATAPPARDRRQRPRRTQCAIDAAAASCRSGGVEFIPSAVFALQNALYEVSVRSHISFLPSLTPPIRSRFNRF